MEFVVKVDGSIVKGPCTQAECLYFIQFGSGAGLGCTMSVYKEDDDGE